MATVQEVKQALSIEAVVAEYVPTLRRAGSTYKACCPFHQEKTPSFNVSPQRQTFKCFGCDASGDVVEFVRRIENLEFREAVRLLAEKAGLPVDFDPAPAIDPEVDALYALNLAATLYYQSTLRSPAGSKALAYARQRGLTEATLERFAIGYAPVGWDHVLRYLTDRGHAIEQLVSAGLVTSRDDGGHYDRFRDRLIFPIRDSKGRVAGFGGRAFGDAQPKYLNTAQTRVFDKGSIFYGQDAAADHIRKAGRVVIVEGYMDALIAHQEGFGDVVASMGTSLTEKQVRMLNRSGRTVVLALDSDAAGVRAVERTIQVAYRTAERELVPSHTTRMPTESSVGRFSQRTDVKFQVLALPEGRDPDELILADPAAWPTLLDGALPIVDFYFQQVASGLSTSLDFKRDAAERLVPILAEIHDPLERDHYSAQLARLLEVSEQTVTGLVARHRQSAGTAKSTLKDEHVEEAAEVKPAPRGSQLRRLDGLSTVERRVWSMLVRYPREIDRVREQMLMQTYRDQGAGRLAASVLALPEVPPTTADLLAALEPAVRATAADILLDTSSLPDLEEQPLERDLDLLFSKWGELAIRARLNTYERALQDAPGEEGHGEMHHEFQALTREIRDVFTQTHTES